MSGRAEGVVDSGVSGEEPPNRGLGLESKLLSLPFSAGKVSVFRPVILSLLAVVMDVGEADFGQAEPGRLG
jgi:hypothetical protein